MKFGVVIFPGSNCDKDMLHVIKNVLKQEAIELWHKDSDLSMFSKEDCIVLPGGFSFGDYLRTGAIARFSPIMEKVIEFANQGGKVIGICNGFQILCEAGLLPGVLLRNKNQKFVCENKFLRAESKSLLTQNVPSNKVLKIPVAHAEGRYFCDENTLQELKNNGQILFRYCSESGEIAEEYNFNGAVDNIAGVMNKNGNVFGMMPHPERCMERELGNEDGYLIMSGLLNQAIQNG